MKKKLWNNNLDERQEQKLLQIEHVGCWIAFWGLLIAMFVQMIIYGGGDGRLAGEWILFMVLAIYLFIACMKNGIWDRRLQPNGKTNMIASAIGALAGGLCVFLSVFHRYPESVGGAAAAGIFTAVLIFVLCIIALSVSASFYRKKQLALNAEPEDAAEDTAEDATDLEN